MASCHHRRSDQGGLAMTVTIRARHVVMLACLALLTFGMPVAWSGVGVPSPPTFRVPRITYEGPAGSIHVMDVDGTNDVALTSAFIDSLPSFSPDGSKIAYTQFNADDEIYVMNA